MIKSIPRLQFSCQIRHCSVLGISSCQVPTYLTLVESGQEDLTNYVLPKYISSVVGLRIRCLVVHRLFCRRKQLFSSKEPNSTGVQRMAKYNFVRYQNLIMAYIPYAHIQSLKYAEIRIRNYIESYTTMHIFNVKNIIIIIIIIISQFGFYKIYFQILSLLASLSREFICGCVNVPMSSSGMVGCVYVHVNYV